MDFKKLINSNIKKLRLEMGLTQEAFAEKIGVSARTISKIECNYTMPSPKTIDKICEVFGILPDALCHISDVENSKSDVQRLINAKLSNLSLAQLKQILQIIETFKR